MTYFLTHELLLDWDGGSEALKAEWTYSVTPYRARTWDSPEELPEVYDVDLCLRRGKSFEECPQWLFDLIRPSDDTLIEHANECAKSAAEDAAEYRRDMRLEAAE